MTNKTTNVKSQKVANKFTCNDCDYTSCKRSDYDKHLSTRKHILRTSDIFSSQNSQQKKYNCMCGKKFKHASSLWNHKKICTYNNENTVVAISNDQTPTPIPTSTILVEKQDDMPDMKELIIALMTQNQNMQKQMLEMMPQLGNTTNNNTMSNSHNNNSFTLPDNINIFTSSEVYNIICNSQFTVSKINTCYILSDPFVCLLLLLWLKIIT